MVAFAMKPPETVKHMNDVIASASAWRASAAKQRVGRQRSNLEDDQGDGFVARLSTLCAGGRVAATLLGMTAES